MAKQMVKGVNSTIPVINIPLHATQIVEDCEKEKILCREKLGIKSDLLMFASFGFASKNKRILQILEELSIYKKKVSKEFKYYIVGKTQGIDVKEKVKEFGIEDQVVVTGFTELDEFNTYMGACDVAINLRYPTNGESSASLHRLLGMGKPIIVTRIGSFEEYPDDIVFKVRYDEEEVIEIYNTLRKITKDRSLLHELGDKVRTYADDNYSLHTNANKYKNFFHDILNNTYREKYPENVVDLMFQLKLTDDSYIKHIMKVMSYDD
jgi:glycosyltransferase involved in cell wall biosynthesis